MDELEKFMEKIRSVDCEGCDVLPCKECGECCTRDVIMEMSEIELLKKNHKSLFKKIKIVPNTDGVPGARLTFKGEGVEPSLPCVFLKDGLCSVYEHRPRICRDYGSKEYCKCGYAGLETLPDEETREKLRYEAFRSNENYLISNYIKFKKEFLC